MSATLAHPSSPAAAANPVAPSRRIDVIDMLRGFALLGILLVNMEMFHTSFYQVMLGPPPDMPWWDRAARWFIAFFAEGKFYSTFAFLFGLGMAIQQERMAARGLAFVPFYLRRMLALALFGLVHAYLFWVGDILLLYSLMGLLTLWLFRNRRPKTLVRWAVVFLIVPLLINAVLFGFTLLARSTPDGAAMTEQVLADQQATIETGAAYHGGIYAGGSFAEVTALRVAEMNTVYATWPFMGFNVWAMYLLGLAAGRAKLHRAFGERLPWLRRLWLWGLVLGLAGNLLYVVFGHLSARSVPSLPLLASLAGQTVGAPALSIFYMTSIVLLAQHAVWQRRLQPLAPVGRMALTNYLMQTVICTTLFYGYGFGLWGSIGPAAGILLAVTIYAVQVVYSRWWLARFRFGPMEWLWRTMSYGHAPSAQEGAQTAAG